MRSVLRGIWEWGADMKNLGLALAIGGAMISGSATAAPVLWDTADGGNGHYYELITTSLGWADALATAGTFSHLGSQGYLVTLTSAAETTFVRDNLTTASYWAAGSDGEVEGVWKWMAGPELGQIFWNNGVTVGYAGWSGGEPNNFGGNEDALQANWSGLAWNDASGGANNIYVVEYNAAPPVGGIPEPSTWAMMILGFGAAGAAMRRRRVAPAVA